MRPVNSEQQSPITMTWEHLLFINIPVSVNRIQAQLPEGMRVDAWNGFAYVSLVPMRLKNFTVKKKVQLFFGRFSSENTQKKDKLFFFPPKKDIHRWRWKIISLILSTVG